jgi:hypothetical protein
MSEGFPEGQRRISMSTAMARLFFPQRIGALPSFEISTTCMVKKM